MPTTLEQGDIFGRIGKKFGEGVGEQVERGQLASQLRGVKGFPSEAADILSAPGGREALPTVLPYIRSQAFARGEPDSGISSPTQSPSIQAAPKEQQAPKQAPSAQEPINKSLLASPQQIAAAKEKILQPATSLQRDDLARKLINSGQVIDVQEAQQLAKDQLDLNRASQKEQLASLETNLSKNMALDLQKGGLGDYQDLAGEIQRRLLDEGRTRYLEGETPENVADNISSIIKDLGKVATQTKATGAISNLIAPRADKVRALKEQKKEYEKYGFGEIFDDLSAAALGITPMQAASELNPLKNEKFKKEVDSYRRNPLSGGLLGDIKESVVNRLVESITPKDNILSMAAYLRDNHLDVSEFLKKAGDKKGLEDEQKRQLQKKASNSFLGDILFRIF